MLLSFQEFVEIIMYHYWNTYMDIVPTHLAMDYECYYNAHCRFKGRETIQEIRDILEFT